MDDLLKAAGKGIWSIAKNGTSLAKAIDVDKVVTNSPPFSVISKLSLFEKAYNLVTKHDAKSLDSVLATIAGAVAKGVPGVAIIQGLNAFVNLCLDAAIAAIDLKTLAQELALKTGSMSFRVEWAVVLRV